MGEEVKPYYEHGGITIYHGDCREILPSLGEAELLLTDPPYGVSYQSNYRQEKFSGIVGDESRELMVEVLPLVLEHVKRFRHAYIFGRFDFKNDRISEPCELIWDKDHPTAGDLESPWGVEHEYIQFFTILDSRCNKENGRGNKLSRLRRGTVLRYSRIASDRHPTEKPIDLLRELIECSSRIGEAVLDPFCGSGSTLEAAKIEGRKAIGIEIEEKYCEIAAKRLSQEVFQF